jgi:uncharacterized protein YcfJ
MKGFERFEKPGAKPRFSNEPSWLHTDSASRRTATWRIVALCALLLAAPVGAQDRGPSVPEAIHYGWADVLRVDPVYDDSGEANANGAADSAEPKQECYEEQVLQDPGQAAAPSDNGGKRIGGTFIGAIVGSIIGSRFGKGDGRKAATAAGAVAGGVVGNNVAANSNDPPARPPRYSTQRRCRPVEGAGTGAGQRHLVGYDVEYRYRGEVYNARMNTDPGDRMRVKVTVTPAE